MTYPYSNSLGEYLFVEVRDDDYDFSTYKIEGGQMLMWKSRSEPSRDWNNKMPIAHDYTLLGASDDEKFPYEEIVDKITDRTFVMAHGIDIPNQIFFSGKNAFIALLSHLGVTKRVVILKKKIE